MPRAALLTLLVASILPGSLQAQRAGGTLQANTARASARSGFAGQYGFSNELRGRSRFFARRFHARPFHTFGSVFAPYFDPSEYGESYAEAEMAAPAPPVVLPPATDTPPPPAKPLVIEIPGATNSARAKVLPPTIFILADGARLEIRRFTLTTSNLSFSIDRKQRIIPVDLLDLNATIAANHQRGVDLHIPADRNEISLSF